MKLEDFVAETLQEVFVGVTRAQQHAAQHGGEIVPANISQVTEPGQIYDGNDMQPIDQINFDVALTVAEDSSAKGGIGVFAGPVGVGAQGQLDSSSLSVSRIQFTVPIKLPRQGSGT